MGDHSGLTMHVQSLPERFGATTTVLGVALDDMSRSELYAVIRILSRFIPMREAESDG